MAEVTEIVPPYSVVPDPNNSATFNADGAVWLGEMNSRINSTNTQGSQMNTVKDEINIKATQVSSDTIEVANNTAEVATNTAKALTYAERAESAVPIGDSYNMDTVDLKDSNVLNVSLPNSGYTKVSKKLDNFVFKEDVNFTYKIADKNKYVKISDKVIDTYGEERVKNRSFIDGLMHWDTFVGTPEIIQGRAYLSTAQIGQEILENGKTYRLKVDIEKVNGSCKAQFGSNVFLLDDGENDIVATSNGSDFIIGRVVTGDITYVSIVSIEEIQVADFANTAPSVAQIISEASGLTTIEITENEHIIIDKTNPSDYTLTTYKAIQDAPIGTPVTDILYFKDVTNTGVKNQAIATQKNLTKDDDGITPLQNGYIGINTEILSDHLGKDKTIEEVLLSNGFTKIKPFLYSKDNFLHTPVERRQMNQNQYMYHPFLNPYGTKKASDSNFWYNTSVSFLTVADCFNTNKLLTNSGDIASSVTGSPRNRYYNVMYEEDGVDSRQYAKLANKIDIDLLKKDKLDNAVDEYFSSISSGSFFDVELLGDNTYYPQILKDRITSGVITQVLLNTVDDNGNSNIPDGIKTSFKMNKKMIQNYEVLKSTDSGVTWNKLTSGFTIDLIANTINFTVAPLATDIILISNEASNNPMYLADVTDFEIIEEDSFVYASNNNDVSNNIVKLINNVTGKISVGTDSVEQLAITKIMNDLVYQTPKTATVDSTIRFFTAEKDGILYAGVRFDNGDTVSIDLTDTNAYVMSLNIGRN